MLNDVLNDKRRVILFISAGLILLLVIAGAVFYYFPKIKKQYVFSFNPYERIFSGAAAVLKEIDLAQKEIKAEIITSAIRKSPGGKDLFRSTITYEEFVIKIAPDAILEGAEKWEDIKPGQKITVLLFSNPNNNDLVLKKLTVFHPEKK